MRVSTKSKMVAAIAVGTALILSGASSWAAAVQVWVLGPGVYGNGADPAPLNLKTIELDALPQRQTQRLDVQYGAAYSYRGVPLRELITHYGPPDQADLVLLYFRSGMVVPLPFRDARVMARLNPLIALQMGTAPDEPLQPRFPPINKHIPDYPDIPLLLFSGNKLVVSERWHPDVPENGQADFSPWTMVDSLSGLGFAESRAYYRQFERAPAVHQGAELYRQSCQFCHGVRKVGASFGWDFSEPIELHTYRKDARLLYFHIHDRPETRISLEQMPVLKSVSEEQALALWRFMRSAATSEPVPYLPALPSKRGEQVRSE